MQYLIHSCFIELIFKEQFKEQILILIEFETKRSETTDKGVPLLARPPLSKYYEPITNFHQPHAGDNCE